PPRRPLAHPGRRPPLRVCRGTGDAGPHRCRRALSRGRASLTTRASYTQMRGPLAQLVEQGTFNPKVAGSSPARPTRAASAVDGELVRIVVQDSRDRVGTQHYDVG